MDPCFPEPTAADDTPMVQGETSAAYLARSTWVRARETRRFLDEAMDALPADARQRLCASLRHDAFGSPLSELVVGLALQGLRPERLQYEAPLATGKAPDWRAQWPDGTVYVEVATPVINAGAGVEYERNETLAAMVRRAVPPGWRAWLMHVPALGPNDTKAPLKKALAQIMADLPADPPADYQHDVSLPLDAGRLEMRLLPARPEGGPPIEVYPAVAYFDNAHVRIEDTVRDKREQARGADHPVLLAIRGALGTHLDAYDIALYGRTVALIAPGVGQYATRFDATGILTTPGTDQPTIAGVLAMPEIGVAGSSEPVLYVHRRFTGTLPQALLGLERRVMRDDGIASVPATVSALGQVHWAEAE